MKNQLSQFGLLGLGGSSGRQTNRTQGSLRDSSCSLPTFYKPLIDGEIRLLFVPACSREEILRLRLVTVPLAITPEPGYRYTALSYVWGTGSSVRNATVDGQTVQTTDNLYLALREISSSLQARTRSFFSPRNSQLETEIHRELFRQLREEPRASFSLEPGGDDCENIVGTYLWVDSLCINQSDMAERTQQVSIMDKIYMSASRVVAWLGIGEQAMEGINNIHILGQHVLNKPGDKIGVDWLSEYPRMCKMNYTPREDVDDLDVSGNYFWDSVHRFDLLDYWTRVWIIQEIILAQEVWFLASGVALRESTLWAYIDWRSELTDKEAGQKPGRMHPFIWSRLSSGHFPGFQHIQTLRLYRHAEAQDWGETHPVLKFLESKCSNPRDKIYGLLGLSHGVAASIPDYSLSVRDVYIDFFKAYLERFQCLNLFLGRAGVGCFRVQLPNQIDLPSWVPDLHQISASYGNDACFGQFFFTKPLRGGAGGRSEPSASVQDGSLVVNGAFVDIVDFIYPDTGLPVTERILATLPPHTEAVLGIPRLQVLCRIFVFFSILARDAEYAINPESFYTHAPTFLHTVVRRTCQFVLTPEIWLRVGPTILFAKTGIRANPPHFQQDLQEKLLGHLPMPDSWKGRTATQLIYDEVMQSRAKANFSIFEMLSEVLEKECRFFHTRQGHLGLGPFHIQKGDRLAVIAGFVFPVVLRPAQIEGKWKLVGACVVGGLMNGEAFVDNIVEQIIIC